MRWAWGLDPGSKRAGFAVVAEDGTFQTNAVQWRTDRENTPLARSLAVCRAQVKQFASAYNCHFEAHTIACEMPTGRFPNPSLMMHTGVLTEAVASATAIAPWMVSPSDWKKNVLGDGAIKKQAYVDLAVDLGVEDDAEQAAALWIAVHAAKELRFDVSNLRLRHQRRAAA